METAMNEMFKPDEEIINLTELREAEEDVGRNPTDNPTMGDVINRRFSRRGFLGGSLAVTAIASTVSPLALMIADEARAEGMQARSPSPKSRPASTKLIMLPKAMMPMCCCAGVTRFSRTRPSSIR
jgi:hypothetical protein